jgi:hypothetical protein
VWYNNKLILLQEDRVWIDKPFYTLKHSVMYDMNTLDFVRHKMHSKCMFVLFSMTFDVSEVTLRTQQATKPLPNLNIYRLNMKRRSAYPTWFHEYLDDECSIYVKRRPMKCTEDICVFSPGGAAPASRFNGNMTYNPQNLIPVVRKKKNSAKRLGKMLNQAHHLGSNNKLVGDSEYTQKFTNYPSELIFFDVESNTVHETQKPVKLLEYLVKTYSNENDVVLDNCMGSGTTGVACVRTGRRFIGMEKDETFFNLAKERIGAA